MSDARNHASLIDACRLARARVGGRPRTATRPRCGRPWPAGTEPAALVVSDAVFSVDGDLAPLAELHAAAREHGALLVLDEAHALGVLGPGGRGAAPRPGIAGEPDVIRTVTLSKSLAGQGGAVLGAPEVIEHAGRHRARRSSSTPAWPRPARAPRWPPCDVLAAEPGLGARARASAARLAAIAADLGLAVTAPDAAVLAVVVGDPRRRRGGAADLRRARRAGRLLPAALGSGGAGLPAAHRAGQPDRRRLRGRGPRARRGARHVRVDVNPLLRQ